MRGCIFLTAADAEWGFHLAGFRQVVTDRSSVVAEFERITREREAGLIIIDERLLTDKSLARLNSIEQRWDGALVVLPAPGEAPEPGGDDYGSRLVRRVLGYQLKLA